MEAALKSLAKQNSISGDSLEALAGNQKLRAIAMKEIQGVGRNGGLIGIEIIDGLVLAKEEWTPQNVRNLEEVMCNGSCADIQQGLVTSAMKVNRKAIMQKYKEDVDAVLAS